MPSDLVVSVRQISNYPATTAASSGDNLLMQAGGPGAPYISINAADLVASALQGGPAMGLGIAPPANADGGLFTGTITVPTDGAIAWNAYLNNGDWRLLTPGSAASIGWDQISGLSFDIATQGSAGSEITWVPMMRLDNAGNLGLPYGTIGVARDPSANNEVVTLNYLANNTVQSFNNRNGAVQLNAQDVYNALKLCDPIATQPWVIQAINASIQNLLYTCSFVNTWNGRKGSVYLMLSDITTVFFQSGQQPIAPSFQLYGAPDPAVTPLPDSPLRIFGSYQHGIITDPAASFASGAILETQPGRNIVWSDDVGGEANLIASSDRTGNVDLLINTSGTGLVYTNGLTTLNLTDIQAGQSAIYNAINLAPAALGSQPVISFIGQDTVVNSEIINQNGGVLTFNGQGGVRWTGTPADPTDLTTKAYVDARLAALEAQLQGRTP